MVPKIYRDLYALEGRIRIYKREVFHTVRACMRTRVLVQHKLTLLVNSLLDALTNCKEIFPKIRRYFHENFSRNTFS